MDVMIIAPMTCLTFNRSQKILWSDVKASNITTGKSKHSNKKVSENKVLDKVLDLITDSQ